MNSKKLSLILATSILVFPVLAQYKLDKPATHGMLITGSETIYASHLPMFHSPHHYQIILELNLSDAEKEIYLNDRKNHPNEFVYTIEPETFILPDMVNHTKKFKASIYRGHFERGGTVIAKDVPMVIDQVIYYRRLKRNDKRPYFLKYILFGNEKEQFIAHQIKAAPDFDEITFVKISDGVIAKGLASSYQLVKFDEKYSRQKFSWKTTKAYLSTKQLVEFTEHQNLYLEFGDLD